VNHDWRRSGDVSFSGQFLAKQFKSICHAPSWGICGFGFSKVPDATFHKLSPIPPCSVRFPRVIELLIMRLSASIVLNISSALNREPLSPIGRNGRRSRELVSNSGTIDGGGVKMCVSSAVWVVDVKLCSCLMLFKAFWFCVKRDITKQMRQIYSLWWEIQGDISSRSPIAIEGFPGAFQMKEPLFMENEQIRSTGMASI